jgi:hypothetical protein
MNVIRRSGPPLLLLAVVVLIVDRQLAGAWDPDATTVALLVVGAVLVAAALYPSQLARIVERVANLKVGAFELGLFQFQHSGAAPPLQQDKEDFGSIPVAERPKTGTVLGDLKAIRHCLVERVDWLDKELGLGGRRPAETLRRLEALELVDPDTARFAFDLLQPQSSDVPRLPTDVQADYLDRAWRFAMRFRPGVFDRAVRARLQDLGWFLADFKQDPRHRPDFLAHVTSDKWLLVAARVALTSDSATNSKTGQIYKTAARWRREQPGFPPVVPKRRVIVIPGNSDAQAVTAEPDVVPFDQLEGFLDGVKAEAEAGET